MAYAPTLTPSTDPSTSPRVFVSFPALAGGTQTVNVTRTTDGRTYKVRGGVKLFAVGGAAVMDFEAAVGKPNSYRAEMFNAAGTSLGFTDAAVVTLPATSAFHGVGMRAWLSQPLNPQLAIQASILLGSAGDLVQPTPGDVFYSEGAVLGTRIGSRRRGLKGVGISILCDSTADADEFQAMFGGYTSDYPAVILIRTAPPIRLPRVLFAECGELHEIAEADGTVISFQMSIEEVAPPSPGLVIPTLRRADIDAAFPTRGARAAAYATRFARDTDYTKAGLAG